MLSDTQLRLYPNPIKLIVYLMVGAAFTGIGVWIYQSTARQGGTEHIFGGVGAALFGLGSLLFLAMLIARQPILEMDAHGIASKMLWKRDYTPWENVAAVGYYRQTLGRGQYADYLIFAARDTSKLKRTWTRRLNSARYPEISNAALTVALSFVFFRSTDKRRAQLLQRITDQFGPIIARQQIRIDTYLQQM